MFAHRPLIRCLPAIPPSPASSLPFPPPRFSPCRAGPCGQVPASAARPAVGARLVAHALHPLHQAEPDEIGGRVGGKRGRASTA
eukprot:1279948-Pleurochrysis_carterae.AAC.1